jgi:prepilin-type processing-associated H-X9-DG protein
MFCADSGGKMPAANWVTMFGRGNNRPLNAYLETPEIARCPSDTGQTNGFQNLNSNYESWLGSSYSTPGRDVYGTERVLKMLAGATDLFIEGFEHPAQKMLTGDAVWLGNCAMTEKRHHWHSANRRVNLLFIDGHVSFFKLPTVLPNNHSRTHENGWY